MSDRSHQESLQELARICLNLKLIDEIDWQGETVFIVRHDVVRFRLELKQAEAFLYRLLNQRKDLGGSPPEESLGSHP